MMPTVEVKPSSTARLPTTRASLRIVDAAAHHGIDIDVKFGVLGQQLQFLVEHLQALLRDVVGHDVVDRDLQVFEAGAIEPLDAVGSSR